MKSILLIGLNHFGSLLAKKLHDQGHQILAVDREESRVAAVLPYVTSAQIGDSTSEAFLRTLGVDHFDVCIVAIGEDFQSSLETASLLKELGARMVVSRADRDVQAKLLLKNGADEVIDPEKQIAEWAAVRFASDHILDYIKLDADHAIFEVPVPCEWSGRSSGQIDIRKRFGISIMGVKERGAMNLSVTPETVLDSRKTMLVLGEQKAIRKCFRM